MLALAGQRRRRHGPARGGIEDADVGRFAHGQAAGRNTGDPGRVGRDLGHGARQRTGARLRLVQGIVVGPFQGQRQQQFQPRGTRRRFAERQQLFIVVDGRMVRAHGVDRAIEQAGADRIAVALAAEWRRDARVRIEKADIGVRQVHVVHAHVAGDGQAFCLGGADQLQARRRRDAAQVHARAAGAHQFKDRVQGDGFGHHGYTRQAQARGQRTAVGDAAAADMRILRAQPDGVAEGVRVLHRAQQHGGVFDRLFRLREADAARFRQFRHFRQRLAFQAHGQRAQRVHVGLVLRLGAVFQHFHQARLIQHRIGVGRAHQARDAALQGRLQFRFQRRLVFVARLAQARGQVDQAGGHHQAGRVKGGISRETGRGAAHGQHFAIGDKQVLQAIDAVGRVDQVAVLDM